MSTQPQHEPAEKLATATIRMRPADYCLLKNAAYLQRESLNSWCVRALRSAARDALREAPRAS